MICERSPSMTISSIYLNLPVHDVQKTRAFWASLGFGFNEKFSDEKALCLELSPRPFM